MKKNAAPISPTARSSSQTTRPLPAQSSTTDFARRAELTRLLPLWPHQLADLSIAGRRRIIATLEKALRGERRRGSAGHWAYDLARHAALLASWRSECDSLRDQLLHASKK